MVPGWNTLQGVENVLTLCAGQLESEDRGKNVLSDYFSNINMILTLHCLYHVL